MKKILTTLLFINIISCLYAQNNLKVIEYKLLKFDPKDITEYTVPKGETWKIESIVTKSDDKIKIIIDGESYFFIFHNELDYSKKTLPFYLPENTKFYLNTDKHELLANISVLKIE